MKLYDRRDYLNFLIVNFPFICSNIPAVFISQLIGHYKFCVSYQDFIYGGLLLSIKTQNQGFMW